MAAFTTTLLALAGLAKAGSAVAGAVSGQRAGRSARQQGWYEAGVLEENAKRAEEQAADALKRGHEAENRSRGETAQLLGTQRATLAAQGIDVASGSAADITGDTVQLGELDALMIRANAAREARGFQFEAGQYRTQAGFTLKAAKRQATAYRQAGWMTLLGGAADLAAGAAMHYGGRGPRVPKGPSVPTGTPGGYSGPNWG